MIAWLAGTFLAVSALLLLVLIVRRPVAHLFGAGTAYALWAVPALRLVLPPVPQLSPEIVLPSVVTFIPATAGATAPLPASAGLEQWLGLALAIWAGGAVIFLLLQYLSYRAFLARLSATARPGRPPSYGGVETIESEAVDGPVAVGIIARRIVVPRDFHHRYSASERRLAMEHELVHHRRGDIWWNIAAILMLALNWFNPLAWFAFRAFRCDQELACDATVAARSTAPERHDYACALVKSASQPGLVAACRLGHAAQLKRRLKMMARHRISGRRATGGVLVLAVLGVAGVSFTSPSFSRPAAAVAPAARAVTPVVPVKSQAPTAPLVPIALAPAAPVSPVRNTVPKANPSHTPPAPPAASAPVAVPASPAPAPAPMAVEITEIRIQRSGRGPDDIRQAHQSRGRVRVVAVRGLAEDVAQAQAGLRQARIVLRGEVPGHARQLEIAAAIQAALAAMERAGFAADKARVEQALERELEQIRATAAPARAIS